MANIFLSYAGRDDAASVHQIFDALAAAGHEVFFDRVSISMGQVWQDASMAALKTADVVVLYISDDAATSQHMRDEYRLAKAQKKVIVAVREKLIKAPTWLDAESILPYKTPDEVVRAVEAALDIPPREEGAIGMGEPGTIGRGLPPDALDSGDVPASPSGGSPTQPPAAPPPPPPPQSPQPVGSPFDGPANTTPPPDLPKRITDPMEPMKDESAADSEGVSRQPMAPTAPMDRVAGGSISDNTPVAENRSSRSKRGGIPPAKKPSPPQPRVINNEVGVGDVAEADEADEVYLEAEPVWAQTEETISMADAADDGVYAHQPQSAAAKMGGNAAAPTTLATPVEFVAYHPPEAKAGAEMLFLVYALTDLAQMAVEQDAITYQAQLGGTLPAPVAAAERPTLAIGTHVAVVLYVSWSNDPYRHTQTWNGSWVRYAFSLPVPATARDVVTVTASIQVRGIEIARIADCQIAIVPRVSLGAPNPASNPLAAAKLAARTTRPYQNIFVSYSRKDKVVMDAYRVAQLALGNQVFVDTYSIRVGEDWRASLAAAIDQADVFQLFWSRNSAQSENVKDEWDYALNYRCADDGCASFIRPVYWETPLADVPDPLSHLNFVYAQLAPTRNWLPWLMLGAVGLFVLFVVLVAVLA